LYNRKSGVIISIPGATRTQRQRRRRRWTHIFLARVDSPLSRTHRIADENGAVYLHPVALLLLIRVGRRRRRETGAAFATQTTPVSHHRNIATNRPLLLFP